MAEKYEPNVKDQTQATGKLSQHMEEFLHDLRCKVAKDNDDRGNWLNKMVTATNQRMGVKRYSNTPYPGAPDIPLPQTDKLIKKAVPNLVLSAWSPKKMVLVKPEPGSQATEEVIQKAKRAEAAMNLLLRSPQVGFFKKLMLAADYAKEKGHCLFRVYEEFKSRIIHKVLDLDDYEPEIIEQLKEASSEELKAFVAQRFELDIEDECDKELCEDIVKQFNEGNTVIEFDQEEITSMPNVEVPLPTKVCVPSYTTDINKANRIVREIFMTQHELELNMDKGIFRKKDLDELDFSGIAKGDSDIVEQQKERNEGVEDNATLTDLYRIHVINCWYKPTKRARAERWVFTVLADIESPSECLLQAMPFPYEFEGWDYEKYDNEVKDPRYFASRGIPEQVRAIQEIMERCINNTVIRDEMNNTPMWEVQNTSEIMDNHIRFVPGEKIPVSQIGSEIKRLNEPNSVDLSSERIMQTLKAYAEEYMGSTDQLFRNATNKGGGKTKGEVEMGIQEASGGVNLEVVSFNNVLSRVYKKMFDLMKERLGSNLYVDGMVITREDFNFPAEVVSNGNLEVSDQRLATQKAFARLGTIGQLTQAGVANLEDLYNGARDWLEKDGVKDPDQFLTDPKIIMQEQINQMQQQLQQMQQQAEQMDKHTSKQQKAIGRNQAKMKKDINNFEGKKEAAIGG